MSFSLAKVQLILRSPNAPLINIREKNNNFFKDDDEARIVCHADRNTHVLIPFLSAVYKLAMLCQKLPLI